MNSHALLGLTMLRHALLLYDIALLCFALLCSAMFSFAMPCHARICFAMLGSASIGYALLMLLHICFDLLSYAMLTYTIICCAIMWFDMLGYTWLCYALLCFPLLCFHFEAGPSPFPRPARKCEKFMWFMQRLDPSRNSSQITRKNKCFYSESQIPRENALFRPLCGGDHSRAQKSEKL